MKAQEIKRGDELTLKPGTYQLSDGTTLITRGMTVTANDGIIDGEWLHVWFPRRGSRPTSLHLIHVDCFNS